MEKKINLVELLKDCPQGMELDCVMFDDVKFINVEETEEHDKPICIKTGDIYRYLTKFGTWTHDENAKCIIFPKGKTTWEGFVPPCKFKNGDIITCGWNEKSISYSWTSILAKAPEKVIDNYFINDYCSLDCNGGFLPYNSEADSATWVRFATDEEKEKLFKAIKENGYKWNEETKMLEKLVLNFKDGDVVATELGNWIAITGGGSPDECIPTYCVIKSNGKFEAYIKEKESWAFDRLATEEEKEKLFNAIKANGYKWNAETKTLEKLNVPKFKVGNRITNGKASIKIGYIDDNYYYEIGRNIASRILIKEQDEWRLDKFDINTLKPFESRVLVRNIDEEPWKPAIYGFSHPKGNYTVGGGFWKYCIPYDGNILLLGTKYDCDEYYKTWEE